VTCVRQSGGSGIYARQFALDDTPVVSAHWVSCARTDARDDADSTVVARVVLVRVDGSLRSISVTRRFWLCADERSPPAATAVERSSGINGGIRSIAR
jgi:hypothetical protein